MEKNQEKEIEKTETEKPKDDKFEKPSYTYWKRESDKPFSNEFIPQKSNGSIEEPQNNNKTGSAWNKAGTWEEKHFNKNQVEEFFNKALTNDNKNFSDIFMIEKIGSYSGDVKFNFILKNI